MISVVSFDVTEFPVQEFKHNLNTIYVTVQVWVNDYLVQPDVSRVDENTVRVGILYPHDNAQVVITGEESSSATKENGRRA